MIDRMEKDLPVSPGMPWIKKFAINIDLRAFHGRVVRRDPSSFSAQNAFPEGVHLGTNLLGA
ncbi:hypothetical protein, partial [Mesorhizobium sp. M7A.F.Ca.CA.002.05.1.1]|uniref:hypothetical protein n=1 Tax=Mesorhizobium sp. M7A.F.Ca.CA.002.05.1.1 TaxID=2496704 RepID=UPI0019D03470